MPSKITSCIDAPHNALALAEHPANRIHNITLAAAVRSDYGSHTATEIEFGSICETFKTIDDQSLNTLTEDVNALKGPTTLEQARIRTARNPKLWSQTC